MPYRKQRSHQERIPWISHHPLDVKRGTFIGEMSRLATLCSSRSYYYDAIHELKTLYIKRGYPSDLVQNWIKKNYTTRWNQRLNEASSDARRADSEDVLVLKTEFNTAWNFFNAKELSETMFESWRSYLDGAERNQFSLPLRRYDLGDLEKDLVEPAFCAALPGRVPDEPFMMPDVRKTSILNYKLITSRKRTRNLMDLTNLWKKVVITHIEEDIHTAPDSDSDMELHRASPSADALNMQALFEDVGFRQLAATQSTSRGDSSDDLYDYGLMDVDL